MDFTVISVVVGCILVIILAIEIQIGDLKVKFQEIIKNEDSLRLTEKKHQEALEKMVRIINRNIKNTDDIIWTD